MTAQEALSFLVAGCTAVITLMAWGYATGKFSGTTEQKAHQLAKELETYKAETTRRFEEAGERMSKLATFVQSVEDRIRDEFVNQKVIDERCAACRRDYERLRGDTDALWSKLGPRT